MSTKSFYYPGDKVRIVECPVEARTWGAWGRHFILPVGSILEVAEESTGWLVKVHNPIVEKVEYLPILQVQQKYLEKRSCVCPAINFTWNGRGCVCGGT